MELASDPSIGNFAGLILGTMMGPTIVFTIPVAQMCIRDSRKATQVELSKSDCMELGVKAPVRESGDVAGSGAITIEGPCGTLELKEGVIIAHNHIHVTAPDSKPVSYTHLDVYKRQTPWRAWPAS